MEHVLFQRRASESEAPAKKKPKGITKLPNFDFLPQPRQPLRHAASEPSREVAVAHYLGGAPGEQHGRVGMAACDEAREVVRDAPDEQDAASDLDCCGGDRGADES
jgi:hypothetical protein